jgi:competence protein ComEC
LEAFSRVGVTHIIALSGFNITIIIKGFTYATKNWSKKLSFLLGTLGIFLFVILVGNQPSIVRAAIMGWLFLLAPLLGRKGDIKNVLIFTAALMILENPFILRWDTGFQLSFLAVLGLAYLSPVFLEKFRFLPKIIAEPLSLTLGAQIFSLPILLFTFGRFSLISPLTNALILPFIPAAMLFGFISLCLGLIYLKIGIIFGFLAWFLLFYVIKVAEIFSKLPFISWQIEKFSGLMIIIYFLILTYWLIKFYRQANKSQFQNVIA